MDEIKIGDSLPKRLYISGPTGVPTDADDIPTVVLYRNAAPAAVVVVAHSGTTGVYTITGIVDATDGFVAGDIALLEAFFAISGVEYRFPLMTAKVQDNEIDDVSDALEDIAVTGTAFNKLADSDTVTAGTPTDDYQKTFHHNQQYFIITADGGAIDAYLEFELCSCGIPVSVSMWGRLHEGSVPGGGDSVDIYAYNWEDAQWEKISLTGYVGIANSDSDDDTARTFPLFGRNVDADGKVRIRFAGTSLETGTAFYLDQLYVAYGVQPATQTDVDELAALLEADLFVDTAQTPWVLEFRAKGTATVLFKKKLYQVDGSNVTSADHLIGRQTHLA